MKRYLQHFGRWGKNTPQIFVSKLAVFFSSFELVRPFEFVFLTISDILFIAAFGMLMAWGRIPRNPYGPATNFFFLMFALLVFGLVASSVLSNEPMRAIILVVQYLFAYLVLAYVVTAEDYETVVSFLKWYLVGLVIGLLIAFYWFWFEPTPSIFVTGNVRLMGMKGDPNGQASIIAASLPLLLYLWLKGYWSLFIILPLLLALLYGLVAAASNSGILATTMGCLIFFAMTLTFKRALKFVGFAVLVIVILIQVGFDYLPEAFQNRVLSAVQSGDVEQAGTFSSRLDLIIDALDILDNTLLLGIGVDQFRHYSDANQPVHSTYLLLWTEGGLVATVGWVGMVLAVAFAGLAILRAHGGRPKAATAVACSFVLLVVGISSAHLYARAYIMPVILALALVITSLRRRSPV